MWTTRVRLRTADPGGGFGTSVDVDPGGGFGTSVDDSQQTEDGGIQGEGSGPVWTTHSRLRTADPGGGFGTSVDDSRQTEDGGSRGEARDQCGRLTAD